MGQGLGCRWTVSHNGDKRCMKKMPNKGVGRGGKGQIAGGVSGCRTSYQGSMRLDMLSHTCAQSSVTRSRVPSGAWRPESGAITEWRVLHLSRPFGPGARSSAELGVGGRRARAVHDAARSWPVL